MSTYRTIAAAAGLLLFLALSGCGFGSQAGPEQHDSHENAGHGASMPDNFETTASPSELPSFLADYTDVTKTLYAQAYEHADILKELNCYCGCMEYNDPHDSLYRCFIAGVDNNGVRWTDHGANCGICLMEARDAMQLADEGKTIDEIRKHIDSTYGSTS